MYVLSYSLLNYFHIFAEIDLAHMKASGRSTTNPFSHEKILLGLWLTVHSFRVGLKMTSNYRSDPILLSLPIARETYAGVLAWRRERLLSPPPPKSLQLAPNSTA